MQNLEFDITLKQEDFRMQFFSGKGLVSFIMKPWVKWVVLVIMLFGIIGSIINKDKATLQAAVPFLAVAGLTYVSTNWIFKARVKQAVADLHKVGADKVHYLITDEYLQTKTKVETSSFKWDQIKEVGENKFAFRIMFVGMYTLLLPKRELSEKILNEFKSILREKVGNGRLYLNN